jgi:hypothetical protein
MGEFAFPVKVRGDVREQMLADYRYALRSRVNPDTQQIFSEDEISLITAQHSEAWIRADALDAVLLLDQSRALWLGAQALPWRASTAMLKGLWSPMFYMPYLPAAGGSGPVSAPCLPSTTFVGSTTIPDPIATYCTDPAGQRYQVLFSRTSDLAGSAVALDLVAVSTGETTNIDAGTLLTWQNAPDTVTERASVTAKFRGGVGAENDQQFVARLLRRIRHKQAAGNRAQMRAWAEDNSSNAVESAFIYPCAFHAGSTLVAITQKRGGIRGPLGRIPSVGTLAAVVAYLTPPGSPVVPAPPHILVVGVVPQTVASLVLDLSMAEGSPNGWSDYTPWPARPTAGHSAITVVTDQTHVRVSADVGPPPGVIPRVMVWNDAISRFEELHVASVTAAGGGLFDVSLSATPEKTLAVGDYISPATDVADTIGSTIEQYFDSLGPGEVIDLSSDLRRGRAFRFPKPNEEFPQRAGTGLLTFLEDALGVSLADSDQHSISTSLPAVPDDPATGPSLLVAGRVGIYPL